MEVTLEESWKHVLHDELSKPYFTALMQFVDQEYQLNPNAVFPAYSAIFAAFNACPFDEVKVVLIGQDPYPTKGHAHGYCFSVKADVQPFPKSLVNIFKALAYDLNIAKPNNGNLERWAKQGVLLLNSILTVREGQPESHAGKGWEQFTDAVIHQLNHREQPLVFVLWGAKAISKASIIDQSKHKVLTAPHPSPLSAHRGFFECCHFSLANQFLQSKGMKTIHW